MKKVPKKYNIDLIKAILHNGVPAFAEKVAPIFRALNWAWDDGRLPTVDDIIEHTDELIDGLPEVSTRDCIHCSAHIQVGWRPYDLTELELILEVVCDTNQYYSMALLQMGST